MLQNMKCQWIEVQEADSGGWRQVRCAISGWISRPTNSPIEKIFGPCPTCFAARSGGGMAPGNVLRSLIAHATGGQVTHGLECELFRQQMNVWGWIGCWRNRSKVLTRIRSQANREGYASHTPALISRALLGLTRMTIAGLRRAKPKVTAG